MDANIEKKSNSSFEAAKLGYEMAIQLWIYEGNSIWSKFNVMLVVHTILFNLLASKESSNYISHISAFGIVISLLWLIMTKKGFYSLDYWIYTARELEENHFNNIIKNVKRGNKFTSGSKITFAFKGNNSLKIQKPLNWLNNRFSAYIIIYLIIFVYIYIFLKINFCKIMSLFC